MEKFLKFNGTKFSRVIQMIQSGGEMGRGGGSNVTSGSVKCRCNSFCLSFLAAKPVCEVSTNLLRLVRLLIIRV